MGYDKKYEIVKEKRVGFNAKEEIYTGSRMNSKSFLRKKRSNDLFKEKRATILNEKREGERSFFFYYHEQMTFIFINILWNYSLLISNINEKKFKDKL